MDARAVILSEPKRLAVVPARLRDPSPEDIVVDVMASGISAGTEKLLWNGTMPPFPGMGYPLVPGYEATGEVVEAGLNSGHRVGDRVFVPGSDCYEDARGLFGGASSRIVSAGQRAVRVDPGLDHSGALLALAATARHALAGHAAPDLIVGHGTLGRLIARIALANGAPAPTVWEKDPSRRSGAEDYSVIDPEADTRRDYSVIYDATGDATLLDSLVLRLSKGGELVLAGFYSSDIHFAFPPAFMREARFRIAAEWTPDDLLATRALIDDASLSLSGLITHVRPATDAPAAYKTAFGDPACLKMILDWGSPA